MGGAIPKRRINQPIGLTGKLAPHQIEGLTWMVSMWERECNCILADDMGLGKTVQSIALMLYLLETLDQGGPHLVVCPKSVCSNWVREVNMWAPSL